MSLKHDDTSKVIDEWIKSIEDSSPINISFLTQPISTTITSRIKTLENIYHKSSVYRYLIKGIYPFILFSTVSGGIGYGLQRTYNRSTKLVLNLLGVLYPTYRCWRLIKENNTNDNEDQFKSWLTYWMIFGSFQVLDHWMESDLFLFSRKKYNLYKLFILYWAQNPHSNGAQVLYRHVIQKPNQQQQQPQSPIVEQPMKKETSLLFNQPQEEEEEHTITIGYSYLDGYNPPNLLVSNQTCNSSDDDDSVNSTNNLINTSNTPTAAAAVEKETYPLLMNTTESAW